jgi:hypothetical protein
MGHDSFHSNGASDDATVAGLFWAISFVNFTYLHWEIWSGEMSVHKKPLVSVKFHLYNALALSKFLKFSQIILNSSSTHFWQLNLTIDAELSPAQCKIRSTMWFPVSTTWFPVSTMWFPVSTMWFSFVQHEFHSTMLFPFVQCDFQLHNVTSICTPWFVHHLTIWFPLDNLISICTMWFHSYHVIPFLPCDSILTMWFHLYKVICNCTMGFPFVQCTNTHCWHVLP